MTIMTREGAKSWWGVDLPREIAYLYHLGSNCFGEPPKWEKVTYREILKKKTDHQLSNLNFKRRSEVVKPGFVWVFYNTPLMNMFFGGWYIYIKTLKNDYAISFRHERNNDLIQKAMKLFPCGIVPLIENFERWAINFAKQYPHKGMGRIKKQGLIKCYCRIDPGGKLSDLFLNINDYYEFNTNKSDSDAGAGRKDA